MFQFSTIKIKSDRKYASGQKSVYLFSWPSWKWHCKCAQLIIEHWSEFDQHHPQVLCMAGPQIVLVWNSFRHKEYLVIK